MVTWNFGFWEIWVAHEFGSVKLKLVPAVYPPQLVHRVPALILNSNDIKNRLLYYGSFFVYICDTFFPNSWFPGRSTPVAQSAPRNLLTRWDVSSIPANGIFLTKN